MLTLLLFRHAKSDWGTADLPDIDRPLNKRGTKAARRMGLYIAREGLKPDLILCSSAARTRETLTLALPEMGPPAPQARHVDDLYLASAATILQIVRREAGDCKRVMVIGHNPGLHVLAMTLVGDGDPDEIDRMARKYPTAALATIAFDVGDWQQCTPAKGRLHSFTVPRELTS